MHSVSPVLDVPKVPSVDEMPSFLKRRLARRYEDRGEPIPDYLQDGKSASTTEDAEVAEVAEVVEVAEVAEEVVVHVHSEEAAEKLLTKPIATTEPAQVLVLEDDEETVTVELVKPKP